MCAGSSRPAAAAASTTTSGPEKDTATQIRPASSAGPDTSRRSERRSPLPTGVVSGLIVSSSVIPAVSRSKGPEVPKKFLNPPATPGGDARLYG
ncbi:hypothetical protein GCM10018790_03440 [Kitasatospora xanthocidica]|nr:hypothetical protein GCM10018790_03440 [Kitasatospora xanthocidica]